MNKNTKEKIPCTVSFLTWNSEKYLHRTLESVKDFAEVIFVDGGSTDRTLEIAKKYGVKVVPQSNPGHPIANYGKERQIGLDASSYDWHLWPDSDDIVSPELAQRIREVVTKEDQGIALYWIRMKRVHPETLVEYKTFTKTYQPRLFKKVSGAHFVKAMHETVVFDKVVSVGQIHEPWMILINKEAALDFVTCKKRAWQRNKIKIETSSTPLTLRSIVEFGLLRSIVDICKHLVRMVLTKIMYGKEAMPAMYEINKIYYIWVAMRINWSRYIKSKFGK